MYSAKEAAEMTGLSTSTLRYYEKEQLLPQIARNSQKYRQYTEEDIEWNIEVSQPALSADIVGISCGVLGVLGPASLPLLLPPQAVRDRIHRSASREHSFFFIFIRFFLLFWYKK